MTTPVLSITADESFPMLGLFLMLIVAGLANRGYSVHQTPAGGLSGFLARRAIDAIAVIGWVTDHLPQSVLFFARTTAERQPLILS